MHTRRDDPQALQLERFEPLRDAGGLSARYDGHPYRHSTGDARTHLHSGEPAKDRDALLASLLAEATNLGLTKMADATPGMTRTRLSWVSDWYVRDECFTKALAEIVNYHHHLPFSATWGDGTTSSSDEQHRPDRCQVWP